MVYFRARQSGACTYFDDRRDGPRPHGLCWAPLCRDLQVVDVPGDHFSLLRQDEQDMSIIVDALQMVLSAFGWHTTIKQDQKVYNMNDVGCLRMDTSKMCIASVAVLKIYSGESQWGACKDNVLSVQ